MPNKAGIDFSSGTYQGKNANNVYQGYNGVVHNPQTSAGAKAHASEMMSSFQDAARNTSAGYNGVVHNPQTSSEAKYNASNSLNNLPKW
ncbi:hypothetical protein BCR35DRAFT_352037 [Leucosporidium creatinivorum]|uniref:Uncharacterized protein n=1 Tax=Leucosporidium creatinivorum TaxID=106004 RepID=A0A1Y2FI25_9BASI|nr:hypothetical protein BCR35DRAFT_352037 [Leucosporidium creatinivorum]